MRHRSHIWFFVIVEKRFQTTLKSSHYKLPFRGCGVYSFLKYDSLNRTPQTAEPDASAIGRLKGELITLAKKLTSKNEAYPIHLVFAQNNLQSKEMRKTIYFK